MCMQTAIARNRKRTARFRKADHLLRRMWQRVFDYDGTGKEAQAGRIIARCKGILAPLWELEARNRNNRL